MTKREKTVEESFQRLEEILKELEGGELNLADSIALFEEGMQLSEKTGKQLQDLEKRVKMLVKDAQSDFMEKDLEE